MCLAFFSPVPQRDDPICERLGMVWSPLARESKVCEFEHSLVVDEQITALDVSVYVVPSMTEVEAFEQLPHQAFDLWHREPLPGINESREIVFHVVEHHVYISRYALVVLLGAHLSQVYNILMLQLLLERKRERERERERDSHTHTYTRGRTTRVQLSFAYTYVRVALMRHTSVCTYRTTSPLVSPLEAGRYIHSLTHSSPPFFRE